MGEELGPRGIGGEGKPKKKSRTAQIGPEGKENEGGQSHLEDKDLKTHTRGLTVTSRSVYSQWATPPRPTRCRKNCRLDKSGQRSTGKAGRRGVNLTRDGRIPNCNSQGKKSKP